MLRNEKLETPKDVMEVSAPFKLGKAFLVEEDSRSYHGLVPETGWMARRCMDVDMKDENIKFMTTTARPPSKREKPIGPKIGSKNLNQTVKKVIK